MVADVEYCHVGYDAELSNTVCDVGQSRVGSVEKQWHVESDVEQFHIVSDVELSHVVTDLEQSYMITLKNSPM